MRIRARSEKERWTRGVLTLRRGAFEAGELLGAREIHPRGFEVAVEADRLLESVNGSRVIPAARASGAEVVPERRPLGAAFERLDEDRFRFRGFPGVDQGRGEAARRLLVRWIEVPGGAVGGGRVVEPFLLGAQVAERRPDRRVVARKPRSLGELPLRLRGLPLLPVGAPEVLVPDRGLWRDPHRLGELLDGLVRLVGAGEEDAEVIAREGVRRIGLDGAGAGGPRRAR